MIGYEAGQSAFGDVYAWFKALLSWPLETILPALGGISDEVKRDVAGRVAAKIIPALEQSASALSIEDTAVVALDWMNGRRTPDANQRLTGAITGIRLGTDAPRVYRSLVEATAFGSRAIVERFRAQGTRIDSAIAIGGVAQKSRFAMQTIADVMSIEVTVPAGEQTVALGAAMFAATAAGLYRRVEEAQRAMSSGTEWVYRPDPVRAKRYDRLYKDYLALGTFVESELHLSQPETSRVQT
jgi:L-ribulokinase